MTKNKRLKIKRASVSFMPALLLAVLFSSNLLATPVSDNGKLRVNGLQLVNSCGNAVQLKGISSHGLQWFGLNGSDARCLSSSAINYMAGTMGADLFRAAVYVESNGYLTDPTRFRNEVDQLVDMCASAGIYIIIDWHILADGDPNTHINEARAFWEYMAQKHAGKDHVLYEICNEPNGVSWSTIKNYADDIIPRIRAYDPDTVIIVGTPNWSQLGSDVVSNQLSYSNIMYTFHFYAASHSTSMLTGYVNSLPIFVTEWGTCAATGGAPYDFNNAQSFLDIMAGNNSAGVTISWANWSWADKTEAASQLNDGACDSGSWGSLTQSGEFIRDGIQNPNDNWTACSGGPTNTPTQSPTPATSIMVNCAGPQYTNGEGVWLADKTYAAGSWGNMGGSTSDRGGIAIEGTNDDTLYTTERYADPLEYRFTMQNGTYDVTLKFAETWWGGDGNGGGTGSRVFDIIMEGTTVMSNLDIFAEAGHDTAYDVTFNVSLNDGIMDIVLNASVDNALINAIKIVPASPVTNTPTRTNTHTFTDTYTRTPTHTHTFTREWTATHTPTRTDTWTYTHTHTNTNTETYTPTWDPSVPTYTFTPTPVFEPIRVNAGGPQYTDTSGNVWYADRAYSSGSWGYEGGGGTADNTGTAVGGTEDDTLYQTERYGDPSYRFDVPNGTYEVTLKFAEMYWTAPGQRVFDVVVEGVLAADNLDLVDTAGTEYAYDIVVVVEVNDGRLDITSSNTVDGALFMAIQIIGYAAPTNTPTFTRTMTRTASPTLTYTLTYTATGTPSFTLTHTPTQTATNTQQSTLTHTATYTATRTFSPTFTPTDSKTNTPEETLTNTPTYTATGTDTPEPTLTHTPTQTATGTPSFTLTHTPTHTSTATLSFTLTGTATYTATGTLSSTLTDTPTYTATGTQSFTRTNTPVLSPTPTYTGTPPTATHTPSVTLTNTVTLTSTHTPQATLTNTPTRTPTGTLSSTLTDTATYTATETFSPTLTGTPTYTATGTLSSTLTDTPTYTATGTQSFTRTNTPVLSPTPTYTGTPPTATHTPSVTLTNTVTLTSTHTPQATLTNTPTQTFTNTPHSTFVDTPTQTATGTYSPTLMPTNSKTATPQSTFTFTCTPTMTLTLYLSPVFTATGTATPADTHTPTFTPTPPEGDEFLIKAPVSYPNPYNPERGGDLTIKTGFTRAAKNIRVNIYTSSYRCVRAAEFTGAAAGQRHLRISASQMTGISNGSYFYVITAENSDGETARSEIQSLLIIK